MSHSRILVLFLVGIIALSPVPAHTAGAARQQSSQSHVAWVADALTRMQTIKPGMTRTDLLKVFTTEGGLFNGLQRTFVSRDCLYFKVDVEFEAVGRPARDRDGRVTLIEDGRDIIVKISRPYLALANVD